MITHQAIVGVLLGMVLVGGVGAVVGWPAPGPSSPPAVAKPKTTANPAQANAARARTLAAQPLRFEPNRGQADAHYPFLGRGPTDLALSPTGVTFATQTGSTVGMRFVGGRADAPMTGLDPLLTKVSYITSSDQSGSQSGLPTYARASALGVYPGIDVIYREAPQGFEYDLVVSPGADPRPVSLAFDGTGTMSLDAHGDLLLRAGSETVRQHRPVAYQDIAGHRRAVSADYVVSADNVSCASAPTTTPEHLSSTRNSPTPPTSATARPGR